jgi:peptide/nickel transport system substrate-binding protein
MRQARGLMALAGIAVILAAGGAAAQAPQRGGVVRIPVIGNPTPNIFTTPGGFADIVVGKALFNTLVKYGSPDLRPAPDLAESWSLSEDQKVWTFRLRKGAKWHDGAPVTAEDVKFTLDAILNPKVNAAFRAFVRGLTKAEVVDAHTVRLHLESPVGPFLTLLAYNIAIKPKHLLEGRDLNAPSEFIRKPVGTGPFKFQEAVAGSHFSLVANPDYFEGRPHLDGVVFKVLPNINTQLAQMRTGELDIMLVEPHQLEIFKGIAGVEISTVNQVNHFFAALNNTHPLFKDRRVRQALAHAVDRQAIVDTILAGKGQVATGPIPPVLEWAYNPNVKRYPFDPERAKALLAEAGWKPGGDGILHRDGQPFRFTYMVDKGNAVREQIATILQQYWKRIGLEVTLRVEEWSVYYKIGNITRDYLARNAWRISPPDPDIASQYMTGGTENHYQYSNPEVDRLLQEARALADPARRKPLYFKAQEIIAEDAPVIWLYYPHEIRAITKRLHGFPGLPYRDALTYLHQAWLAR